MTSQEFQLINIIRNFHDRIYQKIRIIKSKIHKQTGTFFTTHTYSKDELLKSPEFNSIDGIINNLAANVETWSKVNNGFSPNFYTEYTNLRNQIQKTLNEIIDEITFRKPTNWERLKDGFVGIIAYFISKLPNIFLNGMGLPSGNQ